MSLASTEMSQPRRTRALRPREAILDREALDRTLDALAGESDTTKRKSEIVSTLKAVLADGRERARAWLIEDAHGTACAEQLSHLMDEVIRALFRFTVTHLHPRPNPSSAERLSVVAVGGYGRGTLAPGSDVDLLFLFPYKQTSWGEAVVEAMLYVLWDLGLKVGHSTRSVDDCIRLSRADITIRTAVLEARLITGDGALAATLTERFDREVVQGTALEFATAKLDRKSVV